MNSKEKRKLSTISKTLIMTMLIPLITLGQNTKALDDISNKVNINTTLQENTWGLKTINDSKKPWTITLNEEVEPSSVTLNNVYIIDGQGIKIGTSIPKLLADKKSIVIEPTEGYVEKNTYYLNVKRELKSVSGKSMKSNIKVPFVYINNRAKEESVEPKAFKVESEYKPIRNIASSNFPRWSDTVTSYLIDNNDNTISVVEAEEGITIETYDDKYNLIGKKSIKNELPLFGAFYSGKDYNYIAFGQENTEENDDKEVIRIVRYDKNFKRIDSVSVNGGDSYTTVPFDAGAGRMAEQDDELVLHTSRTRYTTEDGLNHQSQLTIVVDTSTMKVTNSMGRFQKNHVSHSFDQYILFDGDDHVLIDHGDAYPRSVVLSKENGEDYRMVDLFQIPGRIGANCTGVSIGGFEKSSENYIVAMNSIDHSLVSEYTSFEMVGLEVDQRDIILSIVPRNEIKPDAVKQTTLAKYVGSNKIASIPQLVKISDEKLMVIWQEYNYQEYNNIPSDLKYVLIDEYGKTIGKTETIKNFTLSKTKPVVFKGKVLWYANEEGTRSFYTIPLDYKSYLQMDAIMK